MRSFLIILVLASGLSAHSQVFNKEYDAYNVTQSAWSIEKNQNRYLVICATRNPNNNKIGIYRIIIDSIGNMVDSMFYYHANGHLFSGWANSLNSSANGDYILGNGIDDGVDYGYLVKFDQNGDTVWTRRHGVNGFFDAFAQARKKRNVFGANKN